MQTPEYVRRMRAKQNWSICMDVWDAMLMIVEFKDQSQSDEIPLIHHLFQTAESLRMADACDWMQLVGLIHDLGVVLAYIRGQAADGTTVSNQWGLTGETIVIEAGPPGGGLDCCLVSYGHAEFMYQVLLRSPGVQLPPMALRVIRYHSLVRWHTGGEYRGLEDATDRAARPIIREFYRHDRYGRSWEPVGALHAKRLRDYYFRIVNRFLPKQLVW
jgi:inositol oxygenase